mgnify:FL=1
MYRMSNYEVAYRCCMCGKDVLRVDPCTTIVMMDKIDWHDLNELGEPKYSREYDFQICEICFRAMLVPFIRTCHYNNYHGKNVVGEDLRNHAGTNCP